MSPLAKTTATKHIVVLRKDLAQGAGVMLAIGVMAGVVMGSAPMPSIMVRVATGEDVVAHTKSTALTAQLLSIMQEKIGEVEKLRRAECTLQNELLISKGRKGDVKC